MKKYLAIMIVLLTVSSCGWWNSIDAKYTGVANVCVDGVEYLQFRTGASVAYNTNGTIKLCK